MRYFGGRFGVQTLRGCLFLGCSALVGTFPFVLIAYTADGDQSADLKWRTRSTVKHLRAGGSERNIGENTAKTRLPRRLHEAFDSYSHRLREDMQLAVETPLTHMKSRFAATGVSTIGWLQTERSQPGVVDGTEDFMVILDALHRRHERNHPYMLSYHTNSFYQSANLRGTKDDTIRLEKSNDTTSELRNLSVGDERLSEFAYLMVPGLLSQYSPPLYFTEAMSRFRDDLKLETEFVKVNSEASCMDNAATIRDVIIRCHAETGKRIVVIGHSKGGLDAAAAVAVYPQLRQLVEGIVFVQSPYGGSPIASDMLEDESLRDAVHFVFMNILMTRQDALHDLTYKARRTFLEEYPLPKRVNTVSFHSSSESAVSPFFLLAKYTRMRYQQPSDGVVACADAEVPGSVVVRFNATQMDHLGPIYPAVPLLTEGPSGADICEALVRLLLTRQK